MWGTDSGGHLHSKNCLVSYKQLKVTYMQKSHYCSSCQYAHGCGVTASWAARHTTVCFDYLYVPFLNCTCQQKFYFWVNLCMWNSKLCEIECLCFYSLILEFWTLWIVFGDWWILFSVFNNMVWCVGVGKLYIYRMHRKAVVHNLVDVNQKEIAFSASKQAM